MEGTFTHGPPSVVFQDDVTVFIEPLTGPHFDAHPDGERFLVIEMGGAEAPRNELVVVRNWAQPLR
jgi:hypothetical protein